MKEAAKRAAPSSCAYQHISKDCRKDAQTDNGDSENEDGFQADLHFLQITRILRLAPPHASNFRWRRFKFNVRTEPAAGASLMRTLR
ncbi:hypothetical protein AYJ54_29105 [Bradyrhizobium centrolobii]|uniref:Uncharacterized protein n=1 Tax=Bradyrhizobium centrolobii TaxID=1505087 RepID=A0A176YBX8_9BRAD|nr:hypothetical protein AYJ54_29105 [Bradyrhizobium centrolobii]